MTTSTIGEVAERTGFTTSALRFYERVGLVKPAARTPAGYRLYDDDDVVRLRFIARAKQLGCTLEEIQDLVAIWAGDRCGPVQRGFHQLVTAKLEAGRDRISELQDLDGQLRAAARQLDVGPVDGPCGHECACHAVAAPTAAALPAPYGCGLDEAELPGRVAEWARVLRAVLARTPLDGGGLRLHLGADADLGRITRLIVAEQACCPFFAFTLTVDQRGTALEVRAPAGATDAVSALFGPPETPPGTATAGKEQAG
jgi:DNA-binding transcriptional MerR regulator